MRHTLATYAKQLNEAKDIAIEHARHGRQVELVLADQWHRDTMRAMLDGRELPRKPVGL